MGRRNRRYRNGGRKIAVIFYNRRRPQSSWVSLGDIWLNTKEWFYGFLNRVPSGSGIIWRGDRIVGHTSRHRN
jgi:hypothetical protein